MSLVEERLINALFFLERGIDWANTRMTPHFTEREREMLRDIRDRCDEILKEKRGVKHWNRCDECGIFIAFLDFATDAAVRRLATPDSDRSREEYETLCKRCAEKEKVA